MEQSLPDLRGKEKKKKVKLTLFSSFWDLHATSTGQREHSKTFLKKAAGSKFIAYLGI